MQTKIETIKPNTKNLTLLLALATILSMATSAHAQLIHYYQVVDLGNLGMDQSVAYEVNAFRQVACTAEASVPHLEQAFAFDPQQGVQVLQPLFGAICRARGINIQGDVAGSSQTPEGRFHAVMWPAGSYYPIDIMPDILSSQARDINESQQIAGEMEVDNDLVHAFLWEQGQVMDLGTLGGRHSGGMALNEHRMVVGRSELPSGEWHAFLWDGQMNDLGVLPSFPDTSGAMDINDNDEIVGYSSGINGTRAVLWQSGNIQNLGTLANNRSQAHGINNHGHIVGESTFATHNSSMHAVLWTQAGVIDLNNHVHPETGWELDAAYDINDEGVIVGKGTRFGKTRAFMLIP